MTGGKMTADKHKPERRVKQKYATFRECLRRRIPIKVSTNTLAVYKALIKIAYEEKKPWIGNDSGLENIRCNYLLFNTTPGGPYSMEATDSEYHYRTLNVAEYLPDVDLLSEINVDKDTEQVKTDTAPTPGTSVKTVRTVPVKEMTWEEAAKCALPCYLWMKNKRGRYSVGLLKGYERGSLGGLPFYGLSAYWDSCKPIDSAIIIVDPPEPAQPEYRPFKTFEELMEAVKEHGDWVDCHCEEGFFRKIITFQITAGGLRYVNGFNLASDDAGKWTFLDGTPFGVPINKT